MPASMKLEFRSLSQAWRNILQNKNYSNKGPALFLLPRINFVNDGHRSGLPLQRYYHNSNDNQIDKSVFSTTLQNVAALKYNVKKQLFKSFTRLEEWILKDIFIDDPDIFLPFSELLEKHGFNVENHLCTTDDGYIIQLTRVSPRRESNVVGLRKPVVLLVHGFQCSSVHWFLNEKDKTLPKQLTNEGFDCWVLNLRGGPQSKNHLELCNKSRKYWDFGFHEFGISDLPAAIDYILQCTQNDALHYIGHSMGASIGLVALSERPEYCEKIKSFCLFAPAVFANNLKNKPIKWIVAPLASFLGKLKAFREFEIFPIEFVKIAEKFTPPFSCPTRLGGFLVFKYGNFFGGIGSDQMKPNTIAQLGRNWPHSTSAKVICHGMQCIRKKKFQQYDYGKTENLVRYGQSEVPQYDLSKVSIPVATFFATDDAVCDLADVQQLADMLPNSIGNFGVGEKFSHGDFLFSKNAHILVYPKVINILKKIEAVDDTATKHSISSTAS